MIKEYTFKAPRKYREGSQEDLVDITTAYKGAESIWIYVDKQTGKNPTFVSEGDLPDPTTTERLRSFKLFADNPNHIMLMDMLTYSKGHTQLDEEIENIIKKGDIPEAPDFELNYVDLKYHSARDYYDRSETHVEEDGTITYVLRPNFSILWEPIIGTIDMMISQSIEKTKDPLVLEVPKALARYQRHIAILTYIKNNLANNICPLKVPLPGAHEV